MASAVLHGLLLVAANRAGLGGPVATLHSHADPGDNASSGSQASRPTPSCEADAALATAAALVYCATPFESRQPCLRATFERFAADRIACATMMLEPAAITLVDPKVLDTIEPEPLLELLTPEEQRALAQTQAQAAEQAVEPEIQQIDKPAATQVVEITQPDVEEAPDNARYVAAFDSRTDKETVARGSVEDMVARPMPKELPVTETPREAASSEPPEEPAPPGNPHAPPVPGPLSMRAPGAEQRHTEALEASTPGVAGGSEAPLSRDGLAAARGTGDVQREANQASAQPVGEGGGGGGGTPRVPRLRPTEDILERAVGGGSVDHLEAVAEGESTALNARRWKYATFFNRLERSVVRLWHPEDVFARHDPKGNVYGIKDRVTYLLISLSPSGTVSKVHVLESSGIDVLDDEAIRALHAAQPFPNPPEGLVDPKTQLITFVFGFHVEVGGTRSSWRLFR